MVSEAAAEAPTDGPSESASTVYNGSVPCNGCGQMLDPVVAAFAYAPECHRCRRRRHHRHVKKGMHT